MGHRLKTFPGAKSKPMSRSLRSKMTSRIIRPGEPNLPDTDSLALATEERIEAVWTLTLACMGWNRKGEGAPRLQRSVVHIQRPRR